MKKLIMYINHEVKVLEAQLQTEESGTKIAVIQGKLAGYNSMISILNEIENTDFKTIKESATIPCRYDDEDKRWFCIEKDFDIVLGLQVIFNSVEKTLEQFNKLGQEKINHKKDYLFYEAEKGRDLHFVKGWFFMFKILNDWKEAIDKQYEYLSEEKRSSLPFEFEGEND